MAQFHLGDVGGVIIATIIEDDEVVDISSSSNRKLFIKTPQGDVIEKTASLYTDGTDGNLSYTIPSGFLGIHNRNLIGKWTYEGYCTLGAWTGTSDEAYFEVADVLRRT
jgi:hypothetical protein